MSDKFHRFVEIVARETVGVQPVSVMGIPVKTMDELTGEQRKRVEAHMRLNGLQLPCLVPDDLFDVPCAVATAKPKRHPNEDDISFLAGDIVDEVEKFFPDLAKDTKREDELLERITAVLAENLDPDDRPDSAYN